MTIAHDICVKVAADRPESKWRPGKPQHGHWQVLRDDALDAPVHSALRKKEAIKRARALAKKEICSVYIHNAKGEIEKVILRP